MFTSNGFPFWFKSVVVLLICSLTTLSIATVVPISKPSQEEPQEVERIRAQAEADAVADGGDKTTYGIGGFLCGILGYIFAAASNVTVPPERLIGKSPTYVEAYSDSYTQKVKKMRKSAACTGWIFGAIIALTVNVVLLSGSDASSY